MMETFSRNSTFNLAGRPVSRMGYGAMKLAGSHAFGTPRDPETAVRVLREAVELGVSHIDTSDFYGPHVTNKLIQRALHPYRANLTIATKVGARRGPQGEWLSAMTPEELTKAVLDNLRNLKLEVLDVVYLRCMFNPMAPSEGSIEPFLTTLANLQQQGLIRHIGLSNVTGAQVAEGRSLCKIASVQNQYNLAYRHDDALIDALAADGVAYVPFFPLGGFTPLQSSSLSAIAKELGATPLQVALAWLLHRSPNIMLIPGTSSLEHLRENMKAAELQLDSSLMAALDNIEMKQ